ncbi:preprotein translocase subunit SecE [Adhaeribacter arboris]|uniref:Protein translocase subunit SecE n=1 Tax=Adhaeribacter arboris TaxID=2072846 RepID=A0A2T2YG65_9BACT|nr:preprotein translocase subunit SecE [Adhaeribacter arboris]PSR54482.1 preprotein translocase subunit SecE [Adhaeribacter arboris]
MEKVRKYIHDTIEEMRHRVSWPKYTELQNSSVLVLIGSVVFAIVVGLMDFLYDSTLSWFYNQF